MERALSFAMEIGQASLPDSGLRNQDIWDPHPFPIVKRTVFICWEPPPPTFLKINFDGYVTGMMARVGFIFHGIDSRLITIRGAPHRDFGASCRA